MALCARAFAGANASNAAVVFAYSAAPDDTIEARLAVSAGGQVNMTAPFDPSLPSPSARAAIGQLLQSLRNPGDSLTAGRLLVPLEAATLRQQFYREVADWFGRIQQGKDLAQRQAVPRHLIRVMFAWILKEDKASTTSPLAPLAQEILRHWRHRTGKRHRHVAIPLSRLRSALSSLWLTHPFSLCYTTPDSG